MKNKMKWIGIGIFAICASILVSSTFAEAALEEPAIHEGDYWNHDVAGGYGEWTYQGTSHDEVVGETTITIEGESYYVWESTMHMEYAGEDFTTLYEGTWYVRESDYAAVKSIAYTNTTYPGGTSSSFSETIYQPIQPDMEYPTDVGDTWEIHRNNTVTDDTGIHIVPEDIYYECTGTEDVTTDVGTFSCYMIKSRNNSTDTSNYTVSYYSNEVGGSFVKMVMYTNSVPTTTLMLTSYEYTRENGDGSVPGFEMVIFMSAIAAVLLVLWAKKYKR